MLPGYCCYRSATEEEILFDLVLIDVHTLDMDGFKLLKFVGLEMNLPAIKAVPKRILELMNVPGLTQENVASHLQAIYGVVPVNQNMHDNSTVMNGFKGPTQMTKGESDIPKSNEIKPKKQKKKANKAGPKETWVPKST
ncbi:hypothetical protein AgCh_032149 [Apium graveolens]